MINNHEYTFNYALTNKSSGRAVSDVQTAAHRTWVGSMLLRDAAFLIELPMNRLEIKKTSRVVAIRC
ncbi:hypothetical protein [Pontibacillus yanchengensis]|uniref:hypothetical protein n=1 Tax=Pontibacillus yanchengensis TaxID=462910 RepID=UPI001F18F666|nr:hypothetical protein [Pontibacillus yanchengensis]